MALEQALEQALEHVLTMSSILPLQKRIQLNVVNVKLFREH